MKFFKNLFGLFKTNHSNAKNEFHKNDLMMINTVEQCTPSKRNSVYDEFVVIDTETTGLNPQSDRLLEIAAIKYKNNVPIDTFHTLVNPIINIPSRITQINGITNKMVQSAPYIENIIEKVDAFIDNLPIVGHNVSFDIGFLNSAMKKYYGNNFAYLPNPVVDTVKLSRKMYPELDNHKLGTIIDYLGIKVNSRHNALEDVKATAVIYLDYLNSYLSDAFNLESNINKTEISFTPEELRCVDIVKEILLKNNRNLELLRYSRTGNYIDIRAFYCFCRIKLNGKKFYVISNQTIDALTIKYPDLEFEKAPKSETGETRIIIKRPGDLYNIEMSIIEAYDSGQKSLEYYRNSVLSSERHIRNYLATNNG